MSFVKYAILAVVALLVLSALFTGAMINSGAATAANGSHLEGAPYSGRGPHQVGTSSFEIEGKKPLEIKMWYPAPIADKEETATIYPYVVKMFPPLNNVAIANSKGVAGRDAAYDLTSGPYPLLILSPGFALGSTTYAWLAEHLASYGFVVMSPEHEEQLDPSVLWQSAVVRQQDVLTVLSFFEEQVAAGGVFEGLVDLDHIAVLGHSYGGYTALAAGGARLDMAYFEELCRTAYETDDPIVFLCDALLPHTADMANLTGLDSIPQGLWPPLGDFPVQAVVSLAGDAAVFGQAGLAEIKVPLLAIGGTADKDSPYMWSTHFAYEHAASPRKVKIGLIDAEHMIFTGPCDAMRGFLKLIPNEFCSDSSWVRKDAHALVKHFVTAFLLVELKQHEDAAAVLAPDTAQFGDVSYSAHGYATSSPIP